MSPPSPADAPPVAPATALGLLALAGGGAAWWIALGGG
jgi:hypothetical protein